MQWQSNVGNPSIQKSGSSLGTLPPLKDTVSKFSSWATSSIIGESKSSSGNGIIDTVDELLMFENENLAPSDHKGASGVKYLSTKPQ